VNDGVGADASNGSSKEKAHGGQVFAGGIVDFLASSMTFVCIVAVFKKAGITPPEWVSAIVGGAVFMYTLLAQRGLVFSVGAWGLGLQSQVDAVSQSNVYLVQGLSKATLSRRAVIIVAYVSALFLLVSML
jgi:hypothetical protein